jgi:hypothetical protein
MIKEKIINQAIAKAEKKIKFLRYEIFENDPISKQFEVHKKFGEFLKNVTGKERLSEKSVNYITELNKEMELHKKRQKTYNSGDLMEELCRVERELRELENERWQMNMRKQKQK